MEIRQDQAAIQQNQVRIRPNIGMESWPAIWGPLFLVLATVILFVILKVECLLYHTGLLLFSFLRNGNAVSKTASERLFVNKCIIETV